MSPMPVYAETLKMAYFVAWSQYGWNPKWVWKNASVGTKWSSSFPFSGGRAYLSVSCSWTDGNNEKISSRLSILACLLGWCEPSRAKVNCLISNRSKQVFILRFCGLQTDFFTGCFTKFSFTTWRMWVVCVWTFVSWRPPLWCLLFILEDLDSCFVLKRSYVIPYWNSCLISLRDRAQGCNCREWNQIFLVSSAIWTRASVC